MQLPVLFAAASKYAIDPKGASLSLLIYVLLAAMNAVAAIHVWRLRKNPKLAMVWLGLGAVMMILAFLAGSSNTNLIPTIPSVVRDRVNEVIGSKWGPTVFSVGIFCILSAMFQFRRFFVKPVVAWSGLNLILLAMSLSVTDENFIKIVGKPDNVPIVAMVFLIGFFTWVAASQAVENDDRLRRGLGPVEKENSDKVLVWPDLVYIELICMVAVTALLLVWSIELKAPLEEPANTVKTPNPSKAPWYFLGLQEMLVYFDPWMAGVVLPSLMTFGLMAIPYIDFNRKGCGYYTIEERKFGYLTFQFGFLVLWIPLIILGTFMRGPNWNIFGPFEFWDPHKQVALNNVMLSEIFWIDFLRQGLPKSPEAAGQFEKFLSIIYREAPGIFLTLGYFFVLPPLMAVTVFRKFFVKMGFIRYMLMTNLLLTMFILPIKMILRWTINLKYIINIPEYFLNF